MSLPASCPDELLRHTLRVAALRQAACFPHPVAGPVRLIETHISSVLLTGDYAYKVKKPVNFGFLDFSTLAARRHFCDEELRLNRRLAPDIYCRTVAIAGTDAAPRIVPVPAAGDEGVLDYAVEMREFAQTALLDAMATRGALTPAMIDALAACIAAFHAGAPRATGADGYGTPEAVRGPVDTVLASLRAQTGSPAHAARVARLAAWCAAAFDALAPLWPARLHEGWVREGHGDLHLGNIAWLHDVPQVFDCIEFSPALRWGDVMNDVAFLVMDLQAHGCPLLAARFLNAYLERTGDYAGVAVLRYYMVYRALVRAMVAGLRDAAGAGVARQHFLDTAEACTTAPPPRLIVMHGLSGSGKSRASAWLAERLPAVRVRSDVERKRLAGLAPQAADAGRGGDARYTPAATQATYARLAALAEGLLGAGQSVIVDATTLRRAQRECFRSLARRCGVDFRIVSCCAATPTLFARVAHRQATGGDPSEAGPEVLAAQVHLQEPLAADEAHDVVSVDEAPDALEAALAALQSHPVPAWRPQRAASGVGAM